MTFQNDPFHPELYPEEAKPGENIISGATSKIKASREELPTARQNYHPGFLQRNPNI